MLHDPAALLNAIRRRDEDVCGSAPQWVLERVVERLEAANSEIHSGSNAATVLEEFYLGAVRFITDQTFDECDVLLDHLEALCRPRERARRDE